MPATVCSRACGSFYEHTHNAVRLRVSLDQSHCERKKKRRRRTPLGLLPSLALHTACARMRVYMRSQCVNVSRCCSVRSVQTLTSRDIRRAISLNGGRID